MNPPKVTQPSRSEASTDHDRAKPRSRQVNPPRVPPPPGPGDDGGSSDSESTYSPSDGGSVEADDASSDSTLTKEEESVTSGVKRGAVRDECAPKKKDSRNKEEPPRRDQGFYEMRTTPLLTRSVPTVDVVTELSRKTLDKFKIQLEATRRAQDYTAREVYIHESVQRVVTHVLVSHNKLGPQGDSHE